MTNNKQPQIDITFTQLARTAILRGSKGKVGLIVFDDTDQTFDQKVYKSLQAVEADSAKYTPRNFSAIKDCFVGMPVEVHVFRIDVAGAIADALNLIATMKLDWIGTNSNTQSDQTAVSTFVKAQEALKKTYKAVVFDTSTAPDSRQVVKLVNETVTFVDSRAEQPTFEFIPTVLGVLAGLPLNRSATFLILKNLASVKSVNDIDTAIQNGGLVMFNDEGQVKFSTAVTSLTTLTDPKNDIFTKIENVETVNLIYNDIFQTFKNDYVGKGKNTTDRQYLFISAVNTYFSELAFDELLDGNYRNVSFINASAQRQAWRTVKGDEVDTWDEEKVINTPFKTKMFLAGDIKLLESTENLDFGIELF